MNKWTYCHTLRIPWLEVAKLIAEHVSQLLERRVYGTASYEGSEYWGFCAKGARFTLAEIDLLIRHVQGGAAMRQESIPTDSESSYSLGMALSHELLKEALKLTWYREFMDDSSLFLVDVQEQSANAYLRYIDTGQCAILLDELKSKDEAILYLRENGSTHSALMDFCLDYQERYHNELCWNYPISDGKHLGTFFLLVEEGVLSLPYDNADKEDYELFCLEDARLCDGESMAFFIDDWDSFDQDLRSAMQNMLQFYRREEEHNGGS